MRLGSLDCSVAALTLNLEARLCPAAMKVRVVEYPYKEVAAIWIIIH